MTIKDKIENTLKENGWVLYHESDTGFSYVKKNGEYGGVKKVCYTGGAQDELYCFDPELPGVSHGFTATPLKTEELLIFVKRIKEWKRIYGEV